MRFFVPAIFLFVGLAVSSNAGAANLYLEPSAQTIGEGGTAVLTVRLDTPLQDCINAVDGVLELDTGLRAVDVSTGNSIFTLWVEPPKISEDKRTISFAGGIPNGYCGRVDGDPQLTNSLMNIVVQAPSFSIGDTGVVPERAIRFAETTNAYLNDGFGTVAPLTTSGTLITVSGGFSGDTSEWLDQVRADNIPPKNFGITLARDDSAYKGKYFVSFNTTDKQTGIDHYEVIEEPLHDFDFFGWGAADAPWSRVTSPYVLNDQTLNSIIRVKAVDKAGNETVSSLVPDESLRGYSQAQAAFYFFSILGGVIVFTLVAVVVLQVRRRRRAEKEEYEYEEESDDEDDEDGEDDEADNSASDEYYEEDTYESGNKQ